VPDTADRIVLCWYFADPIIRDVLLSRCSHVEMTVHNFNTALLSDPAALLLLPFNVS